MRRSRVRFSQAAQSSLSWNTVLAKVFCYRVMSIGFLDMESGVFLDTESMEFLDTSSGLWLWPAFRPGFG